jgi:hypothetical protein
MHYQLPSFVWKQPPFRAIIALWVIKHYQLLLPLWGKRLLWGNSPIGKKGREILAKPIQPEGFQPEGFQPGGFQPEGFQPEGFQPEGKR